jgi:hypothetical protein
LAIFGLLCSIYLLTFSGKFTAVDELATYAEAESLVQLGTLETPQLAFTPYHNPVGTIEPGLPVLAAPLYWVARQFDRLSNIQTVMLLNPIIIAATAAILYATCRTLGYSPSAASVAALSFGLATLAWPYARSFLREPLVGFGWSVGLFGLVSWRYKGNRGWAVASALIIGMTLLVKATAVSGLPFIFIAVLAGNQDRRRLKQWGLLLPLLGIVAFFLFQSVYALRYGSAWSLARLSGYSLSIGAKRTYGLLLSPGKGMLFYMPGILLAIPGFLFIWRRHRAVALASALPLLTVALGYSTYNVWHGSLSWGPRFLVPTLPLIMILIAPLWDAVHSRFSRALILGIITLSFIFQLSVATAHWWSGVEPLYESGPDPENSTGLQLANIHLSPPLVQLQTWRSENLNLLWLHGNPDGSLSFSARLGFGLMAAVIGAATVWWLVARRKWPPALLIAPPVAAIIIMLAWGPAATPGYPPGLTADQGRELAAWPKSLDSQPYTLVTVSNDFQIYFYLSFLKGDFTHHWYSPSQHDAFDPILQETKGDWLFLNVDRVHIQPENSGKELEFWLNEHLYRVDSKWVGAYELVRYAIIPPSATAQEWQSTKRQFGDSFAVNSFALSQERLSPGDTLGIQLDICRIGPLPAYHHLFVNLVAPGGVIGGQDGPIRYGGTIIFPWEEGDCLLERRALSIPADAAAGDYELVLGFDTPEGPLPIIEPWPDDQGHIAFVGRVEVISEGTLP